MSGREASVADLWGARLRPPYRLVDGQWVLGIFPIRDHVPQKTEV